MQTEQNYSKPKKTKIMTFGSNRLLKKIIPPKLTLYNELLSTVKRYTYLGVTLDCCLTYNQHISETMRVVSQKIHQLAKIRKYINSHAAITIYNILPYLDYGDILYMMASQNLLQKLQRLQNRALRICLQKVGYCSITGLNSEAKVAFLKDRRYSHMCNLMYKRQTMSEYVDERVIPTRGRNATIMSVPMPHNETFKRSVIYNGSVIWNALDVEVRNIDTHEKFKYNRKQWLKSTI